MHSLLTFFNFYSHILITLKGLPGDKGDKGHAGPPGLVVSRLYFGIIQECSTHEELFHSIKYSITYYNFFVHRVCRGLEEKLVCLERKVWSDR